MTPYDQPLEVQAPMEKGTGSLWYTRAMEHLVDVVQELSHVHTLDEVVKISSTQPQDKITALEKSNNELSHKHNS